ADLGFGFAPGHNPADDLLEHEFEHLHLTVRFDKFLCQADEITSLPRIHFPQLDATQTERPPWIPGAQSVGLKLIQQLRDEAHRFAITGHRRRRARRFNESILETVPGLGPAKRRALLQHFGGLQGVLKAGRMDLERAPGIGPALAQNLYDALHPGE
ncbi:MAG: hypothetical protein EB102_04815, partial [Gammaproteobacteria bacterium]|nr:hypothetical protein [Gammaproteobacteria bacterium]